MSLPRLLALALAGLFACVATFAANLAPELLAPLPELALARGADSDPIELGPRFRDPDVRLATRISVRIGSDTRTIDLALLDEQAPKTVANFLAYVDAGRYAANFFHRSVPGFVVQNGGFYFVNDTTFDYVPTYPPLVNEPGVSNTRGTVAMAKLGGDPDSATSQWFINLGDNSANLDAQNGGFTVFARVLGAGMEVADEIAAITRYNASSVASAWTEIPLSAPYLAREYFIETSVARIAPLAFAASSDDPGLVAVTISDGTLSLVAGSDRTGSTRIRVTATDLEGGVLETSFSVSVKPTEQSIDFPPLDDLEFGAFSPFQRILSASASSGLPVSFELVAGPASLSGSTLSLQAPGQVTIRATQAGDARHAAANAVERSFTVRKKTQTLAFPAAPSLITGETFDPGATSSSGLPVSYTVVSGAATVLLSEAGEDPAPGARIRVDAPGTFVVRATQPGDEFHAAASLDQSFTAAPPLANAAIRLDPVVHDYDRKAPAPNATTEPPGLAVRYTYQLGSAPPTPTPPVDAGRYVVTATIDDPRTLSTASARSTLVIRKAPLLVRARDARRPVGAPNPVFELEYSGFPGDQPEPIDRPPRASTRATSRSPQGEYEILVSGGVDNNFTFTPSQPPGRLFVEGVAGVYEALIGPPPEAPVGKLVVTFPRNSLAFTGVLTLSRERRPLALKSAEPATFDEDLLVASASWSRAATETTPALALAFTVNPFEGSLRIGDETHPFSGEPVGSWAHDLGLALGAPHTLDLAPPAPPPANGPEGHGHATGKIDSRARLSLAGRLADATPFTWSGSPDPSAAYRVWASPYAGRARSYLAGLLGPEEGVLAWRKEPLAADAKKPDVAYRAGIGPLLLDATLREWNPRPHLGDLPLTLAESLGLTPDTNTGAAPFRLELVPPSAGTLSDAQLATVPDRLALSRDHKALIPSPNTAGLSLKVNVKTGAFSGSFRLTDLVSAPTDKNPGATRLVTRKVAFFGVLRQDALASETDAFGHGAFLLPALPGAASDERVSGKMALSATPASE